MWDEITNRKADYLYSAVMLNTDITYRTINELEERNVFRSYRDFYDKELLNSISKGKYDLRPETVHKISRLLDSYGDILKCVTKYEKISMENRINVVSVLDKGYPYNWKVLSGMPKVFYTRGNYSLINSMTLQGSVAVVGSRNPSKYAQYATDQICKDLGNKGITIVSGLAAGIDRQAHISALNTVG